MGFGKFSALAFCQFMVSFNGKVGLVKNCGACKIKSVKGVVLVFRQSVLLNPHTPNKACTRRWGFCGNLKQFPTPFHFSGWTAFAVPAPARVTQTVRPHVFLFF